MTRYELIEKLSIIEKNDDIVNYQIEGIDIWPILKIHTFFLLYSKQSSFKYRIKSFVKRIQNIIQSFNLAENNINGISRNSTLFFSNKGTITNFQGKHYDKFGDPILDSVDTESFGLYYDLNDIDFNFYYNDRYASIGQLESKFRLNSKLRINSELYEILNYVAKEVGISQDFMLLSFKNYLEKTLKWNDFFKNFLKDKMPERIYIICYYNEAMFGLVAAANKLGIETIDVQHGTQGELHAAYNYKKDIWDSNSIPSKFWVWDKISENKILDKIQDHDRVLLEGNPWTKFIADKCEGIKLVDENEKIIVFTHQKGVEISDQFYLEVKASDDNIKWFFRFHPRVDKSEKQAILYKIQEYNVNHKIEIGLANELPLPYLLQNASVHISDYSGSLLESNIIGVPLNITIGIKGFTLFEKQIKSGEIVYCNLEDKGSLSDKIRTHLNENNVFL